MKEQIEWFDIKEVQPDDNKDTRPLLTQRHGSFEFSIWNRLSYRKDEDDLNSQKLYRWVVSPEIKCWARIKGVIK